MNCITCNTCGVIIPYDKITFTIRDINFTLLEKKNDWEKREKYEFTISEIAPYCHFNTTDKHFCRECLIMGVVNGLKKKVLEN